VLSGCRYRPNVGAALRSPDPIKPGLELYGDVLLATGHAKEAAAVYEEQLLRTPNRTPSVKALARAKGNQISMATPKP
jgi:hypothetical protein